MNCRKTYYTLVLLLLHVAAVAQDIHFSQFFQAPLLRNPALAGLFTGDLRVQGIYRDQWNSVTKAYSTSSLEAEYKMPVGKMNDYVTAGLQVLYDRAGDVAWTSANVFPAINYHKSLSNDKNRYLSLGFMGGVVQHRLDRSKITTNSTYDFGTDGEYFNTPSYTYMDGSVGMSYNAAINGNAEDNYFIGVAYHHFNRPRLAFYNNNAAQLYAKWVYSAGIRFGVSDAGYITLQADHSQQGGFRETVAGGMYGLKLGDDVEHPLYTIHAGAFIRWNDALVPVVKLDYTPFSVAVSYDVNISKLKTSSYGRGGFEISVTYIGIRQNRSSVDETRCPRF